MVREARCRQGLDQKTYGFRGLEPEPKLLQVISQSSKPPSSFSAMERFLAAQGGWGDRSRSDNFFGADISRCTPIVLSRSHVPRPAWGVYSSLQQYLIS